MATIGLKNLVVAKVLTDEDGAPTTYEAPKKLPAGISVGYTPTVNTSTLFGDDVAQDTNSNMSGVEVTVNTTDLTSADEALLLGHEVDSNGVVISNENDEGSYVAIGFNSPTSDGQDMYVWLYKGRFSLPPATHNTKGESIEYQTPILTGRFLPRKSDGQWRAKVKTGDATVPANIGTTWFTEVYEKTAAPTV